MAAAALPVQMFICMCAFIVLLSHSSAALSVTFYSIPLYAQGHGGSFQPRSSQDQPTQATKHGHGHPKGSKNKPNAGMKDGQLGDHASTQLWVWVALEQVWNHVLCSNAPADHRAFTLCTTCMPPLAAAWCSCDAQPFLLEGTTSESMSWSDMPTADHSLLLTCEPGDCAMTQSWSLLVLYCTSNEPGINSGL